ncbi:hypothetical protein [Atribacter sp.]|jgi:hypothetical protein
MSDESSKEGRRIPNFCNFNNNLKNIIHNKKAAENTIKIKKEHKG